MYNTLQCVEINKYCAVKVKFFIYDESNFEESNYIINLLSMNRYTLLVQNRKPEKPIIFPYVFYINVTDKCLGV